MTLTRAQELVLSHLTSAYVGPDSGDVEVLQNPPNRQYAVGMLFPRDAATDADDGVSEQAGVEADVDGIIAFDGEMEENGSAVPIAEDWRPSSAAISFITDSDAVVCDVAGATYAAVAGDGPPSWRRTPFAVCDLVLAPDHRVYEQTVGDVPIEIGSRWRPFGDAHLVTVHLRVLATSTGDDRLDATNTLYQVALAVSPGDAGAIREYDTRRAFDLDDESAELRLRFRNRKVYAVGHGMAADWTVSDGVCTQVRLEPVPHFVVPDVETTGLEDGTREAEALRLDHLATLDENTEDVIASLHAFVRAFGAWIDEQDGRAAAFGPDREIAERIVGRSQYALKRMNRSLDMLGAAENGTLRAAFSLAMAAMRLQMRQASLNRDGSQPEPRWRPFQLGFLLVSLASTVDETHEERGLVDLIWFPTGGGKTEAYLGLAAIEIFRRRLTDGAEGGGTAVLTRYTLRLLTSQQFQRAASLVCAMELLRRPDRIGDPRAKAMTPFSIGLWVGNEVTPGTRRDAQAALERLHKAARPEEANQFQVESCPWCATPLLPSRRSSRLNEYGVRMVGRDVVIHCVNPSCEFADEVPVCVVDEMLYENPPTVLLATVDKFARLQFRPEAGRLLGLNTPFRQPSMIIQDELHLLSGPLGTTVAVFDAVIQMLLASSGSMPKIVASTATIRASDDQVQGLYGRPVALYPPSGIDDDNTFFSRPVTSGEGRLYLGLMPQAMSQMSATVSASAPLIEIPEVLRRSPDAGTSLDAYWTAVLYHNSLRELGRTGTLVVDDVNARLEPRADRLGHELRTVRAGRVLELTSRRGPEELPNDLRELRRSADESDQAVDVVLSSNMLSVGIDIPRLALMLMVGQPKTTSEYIQATSRVGRGKVRGVVTTLFRSNRARDRSQFETFRGYHEALYRSVEPTSVTPWSLASRERSLAGALVALIRHLGPGLASNDAAKYLDLDDVAQRSTIDALVSRFLELVERADDVETSDTRERITILLNQWDRRARDAREAGENLLYDRVKVDDAALFRRFGQPGEGWLVADSMRSVEPNVAVEIREPFEEGSSAKDQA
ncbi:helicase-related protein [Agromyces sp. H3Y2-19a]|uniref:helicase-related protein n=1 Tax=Agromyces chromiiresistens TaxID=3030835 RepID=UPI0023B894BE|nr:helicase-related protein [Agromyces chromiiresistens]MDF0512391.1 helicase-related protein [Agromyces chromiiresistens]